MITYVVTISKVFPTTHIRKGQQTCFLGLIERKKKIHTIRGNYDFWAKRFQKIERGEACLSIRTWDGVPYYSNQTEHFRLTKEDGIGIQKVLFDDYLYTCNIDGERFGVNIENIPANDGLDSKDFESWFRKYDFKKPLAIIHFTNFRYKN